MVVEICVLVVVVMILIVVRDSHHSSIGSVVGVVEK